jgi:hypothetical protein
MTINLPTRLVLASAALLASFGAARALQDRGMPTEPFHPAQRLEEDMPTSFGSWIGVPTEKIDARVFQAIGAEMAINRVYKQPQAEVVLHCDVFLKYGVRTLHPPELCYPGSGFTIANSETVDIPLEPGGRPARLLTLDREGQRVYCLFWYQIGDTTFMEGDGQRRAVQSLRGQTVWPPMIKVMLQCSGTSPEEAATALKALASLVYPWTRDFH